MLFNLNKDSPIEAMLRPPVEFYSAITAAAGAVIAFKAPHAIMMTPSVGYGCGAVLLCFAAFRFNQGLTVHRYQKNLLRLKPFSMKTSQVPTSKSNLWIGKGFEWRQRHTQRLWDCKRSDAEKYIQPSWLYNLAREVERRSEYNKLLKPVAAITKLDIPINPLRKLPPLGGSTLIHGVEPNEKDQYFDLGERVGHMVVYGTTRVGKSRLAEVIITQDIARGDGCVICVDPKGDAGLMMRMYAEAKAAGREDDFYVMHLGFPDISARYNAVGSFSRISEVASRISNQLGAEGNSAAFKEFAWRFINIVARALVELGQKPDYEQILKYIVDIEPLFIRYSETYLAGQGKKTEGWQTVIGAKERNMKAPPPNMKGRSHRTCALESYFTEHEIFDPVIMGLRSAVRYDKTYFDKLTASLLPLLEKLTSGRMAELISPDYLDVKDPRPILDWMSVIRKKAIVYIGLDAMTDGDVASAVGNSMFSDLVSTSGHLYKVGTEDGIIGGKANEMPKIYLHADEFNELSGDEFVPLLNKAGGSGVQVTAYTQTRSDLEARIGNAAKARQIEGNFNTIVMLRVKTADTAELLTNQLPEVSINQITQVSGVNDSSTPSDDVHFTSKNEDRISTVNVPMIEPSSIINLPKGQAFALVEGAKLLKLRFPLLEESDTTLPPNLKTMADRMKSDYRTADAWWNDVPNHVIQDNYQESSEADNSDSDTDGGFTFDDEWSSNFGMETEQSKISQQEENDRNMDEKNTQDDFDWSGALEKNNIKTTERVD
ncbi:type IV conjugative transfer system coupling protein TraD [Motilimonas cestriensis]|uniref:type IV conjugative transfer system coupling protein TraD n=1 Tax=Motilimonas cestriensis TaxID=2742685 RepID=UPI003DA2F753